MESSALDLFNELTAIVDALDGAGIPYALVGCIAVNALVEVVCTSDLDFLVLPKDWARIPRALKPAGFLKLAEVDDFDGIDVHRLTGLRAHRAICADFLIANQSLSLAINEPIKLETDDRSYRIAPPRVVIDLYRRRNKRYDGVSAERVEEWIRCGKPPASGKEFRRRLRSISRILDFSLDARAQLRQQFHEGKTNFCPPTDVRCDFAHWDAIRREKGIPLPSEREAEE